MHCFELQPLNLFKYEVNTKQEFQRMKIECWLPVEDGVKNHGFKSTFKNHLNVKKCNNLVVILLMIDNEMHINHTTILPSDTKYSQLYLD